MEKLYVAYWDQDYNNSDHDEVIARASSEKELDDKISDWIDARLPKHLDRGSEVYDVMFKEKMKELSFHEFCMESDGTFELKKSENVSQSIDLSEHLAIAMVDCIELLAKRTTEQTLLEEYRKVKSFLQDAINERKQIRLEM